MRVQLFLVGGAFLVALTFVLVILRLRLRTPRAGQALVITGSRRRVAFARTLVLPFVERAETLDISTRVLVIEPDAGELLITKDHRRLTYRATFNIGVNRTADDVLRVADALGCERASDPAAIEALFRPKLVSGLRLAAHYVTSEDLQDMRGAFQDEVMKEIGVDLNGFVLEDLVVDRIAPADSSTAGPFR
jgi:uncharacterized membrane protein YqiK